MDSKLFEQIKKDLKDRSLWEDGQATWYKLRYEGIKRVKKPYPNAPDMHYPLVDTQIEKIKPFYIQQIYGQERLATFVSGKPQGEALTGLAERLFDSDLKQHSNFERAIYTSVDHMLMYSRGPIKTTWDVDAKRLKFSPVRPIYIIVPSWTEELGDADRLVHILHYSEDQYRRNKNFNQDDDFIKSIKGRGNIDNGGTQTQEDNILRREGITVGQNDNQIVLWEAFSRDGDKILVDTISPIAGPDKPVRAQRGSPYKHGKFPFTDMRYELADADYYSTRGIAEILSHYELDLCKLWNHKLQFLDFSAQPVYKNSGNGASNTLNFTNAPGKILPQGIEQVEPVSAPIDFKEEMEFQRALAEDRVQMPDLSAGEHLSGNRGAKGQVTATQINALVNQSSGGNEMRGRVFRLQLADLFAQAWSLRCQFAGNDQLMLEDFSEVPVEALHEQYQITPSGSADGSSKEQRISKAVTYRQMFQGDPAIKQEELTKWTLEQDDASLVNRLWQEPAEAQQDQADIQASEIVLMLNGWSPRVHENDDDKTHVTTVGQWVEHQQQQGLPISPDVAGRLLTHIMQHAQQMKQKRDQEGMALIKQMQPVMQYLQGIAAQGQPAMPQGQGAPAQTPPTPEPPPQDKPSAVANALAALMKAGVNVDSTDVNAALVKMGLPPMAQAPPPVMPQATQPMPKAQPA